MPIANDRRAYFWIVINAGDDELLFAGGGADPFFGPADGATLGCPLGVPGDPLGVGNALPGVGEVCGLLYQTIQWWI